jgi:acyl-CoA hydrolase
MVQGISRASFELRDSNRPNFDKFGYCVITMGNHKLVLPEHLNHFGFLFGGNMLAWVDEVAWIAASLDFPGAQLVTTVGMDEVAFRKGVREGTILKFDVQKTKQGETSVTYEVLVRRARMVDTSDLDPVFSTHVTFVRVDGEGKKVAL